MYHYETKLHVNVNELNYNVQVIRKI